jgi:hypothetical protein
VILNPARYAGFKAWDAAFVDLKADVDSMIGTAVQESEVQVTALENLTQGQPCIVVADGDIKARRSVPRNDGAGNGRIGWPVADIASGAQGVDAFPRPRNGAVSAHAGRALLRVAHVARSMDDDAGDGSVPFGT